MLGNKFWFIFLLSELCAERKPGSNYNKGAIICAESLTPADHTTDKPEARGERVCSQQRAHNQETPLEEDKDTNREQEPGQSAIPNYRIV